VRERERGGKQRLLNLKNILIFDTMLQAPHYLFMIEMNRLEVTKVLCVHTGTGMQTLGHKKV